MHYFKPSFYLCLFGAALSRIYGGVTGQLALHLTGQAWLFAFLVSICASVGAISLFQLGIRVYGRLYTAAILSGADHQRDPGSAGPRRTVHREKDRG